MPTPPLLTAPLLHCSPIHYLCPVTFSEFPYTRPDLETFEQTFTEALEVFQKADSAASQIAAMEAINEVRSGFDTQMQIAMIRHTIDTRDAFYAGEQAFYDEHSPIVENLVSQYYKALVGSPFRKELEAHFGPQLFRLADMSLKTFSPEIMDLLVQENKLGTKYTEILASASIPFEGEERNLSEFGPFMRSPDRDLRKRAAEARWGFLAEKRSDLEQIFHELVQVRHAMASKLGYDNFIRMGYDRMLRSDYDEERSAFYREQIRKYVVPIAGQIRQEQAGRLGLDHLKYYDEALQFPDGNATPNGDPDWIIAQGRKMYEDLSAETTGFIHYMLDNGLMDLVAKKGKAGGGYCTYITGHNAPFIFSNFNGTSGDIDVLTHEVGHAFQVYLSKDQPTVEYYWPTSDAAEIHSMSMEFFTYPFMDLFFNGKAERYRFSHTLESVLFLPYGVAVDEFQHVVYGHPDMSVEERNQAWKEIEAKYLPDRDFDGFSHLSAGTWWQTQSHIYQSPFYYIDYTLAQMCAFQFWMLAKEDRNAAFDRYIRLCKAGGSRSFLELVDYAGLQSPFEQGVVENVIGKVSDWIANFDRSHL